MNTLLRRTGRVEIAAALFFLAPGSASGVQAGATPEITIESLAATTTQAVVLIDVQTATDARQGSGFLVDPRGLIITNQHVIRDARTARIKLTSGDVYDRVIVLAQDERRDIAVLQIAGYNLPTVPMGDSDSVGIGTPVVVIGSPLGLENTVSTGIVSGRRQEPEGFQLLQVTAPVSQGSSGGAVLGPDGSAVGIVSSQLQAGQNLNFAVPINYARGLLEHLDREPHVVLGSSSTSEREPLARPVTDAPAVNEGLVFDVASLSGLLLDSRVDLGDDLRRQTRVTYRIIETVGGGATRLERYLESETTLTTEPFGTQQTLRRERVRTLVHLEGLTPISSRGETRWMSEAGWREARHDVRFEGGRALGVLTDSTGLTEEIDRTMPEGVLVRDMRDVAFATLDNDSLIGLSVQLTTFDPETGDLVEDRYDVLGSETMDVAGSPTPVLRANVATGLTNQTVFFLRDRPRLPVRRISQDGARDEVTTRVESLTGARRRPGASDAP